MNPGRRNSDWLEKKLFSAWKEAGISPAEDWTKNLMKDIKAGPGAEYGKETGMSGAAWRFAIAAGIAGLIILCFSAYAGILPEMELSALFVFDPGGSLISPPFSVV